MTRQSPSPKLVEPLSGTRILAKPQRFAPLRTFSCGERGSRSEKLVNRWAQEAFRGERHNAGTVLVLEDAQRRLIGLSSFRPRPMNKREAATASDGPVAATHYIHIIAVDRLYRGQRLQDNSRLGDVLMLATLEHIERSCDGRMPRVWAIVTPENRPAQALFRRHGFKELGHLDAGENEFVYAREPGLRSSGAKKSRIGLRLGRVFGRSD
jgi:ribosomal protein S18 acetylase RimI-like enzyme